MITFKENTFVKGTYDELMEMAKAIEEKGVKVYYRANEESNHLWWSSVKHKWFFEHNLSYSCDHELTKSQLYEAYGIVETRPIQISKETATRWYNGEDNELKQLAIQTFPELDEATPKVGDLCLFSDNENELNQGLGRTGTLKSSLSNGEFKFERKAGGRWKYCKKIKSIEFY